MAAATAAVPETLPRKNSMLPKQHKSRKARCGELAGGATADLVSVCCCGPYMVLDLLILAAVRVPVGMCRKAMRKRRLRKRKEAAELLCPKCCVGAGEDESSDFTGDDSYDSEEDEFLVLAAAALAASGADMTELEKELLEHFGGTGFWRSPSQRDVI